MTNKIVAAVAFLLAGAVSPYPAFAQGFDTFGTRGAAMGAFVAVADDATAVAWNPAGLVSGPMFNAVIDLGRSASEPDEFDPATLAGSAGTTLIAFGAWPLGLSYYRLSESRLERSTPAVVGTPDRQDPRVDVRTLATSHLGATVQQSIGDFITVGATLKLVRGSVGVAGLPAASWAEAFDGAEALEKSDSMRGDVDAGAMVALGSLRAGLVVRNVTAPTFGDEEAGQSATLERHVRVGAAWGDGWPGLSRLVVAVDADLTRVPHAAGERRDVAAGVERWFGGQRFGVRGGLRASTIGEARPVVSAGGSYALRSGIYVDAYVARGARDQRAWGVAARLAY